MATGSGKRYDVAMIGAGINGLPRFGKDGIKVARHVTGGRRDDPDRVPAEFEPDCIEDLRDFA